MVNNLLIAASLVLDFAMLDFSFLHRIIKQLEEQHESGYVHFMEYCMCEQNRNHKVTFDTAKNRGDRVCATRLKKMVVY